MKGLLLLVCYLFFVNSKKTKRESNILDNGKDNPLTWLIINQLNQHGAQLKKLNKLETTMTEELKKMKTTLLKKLETGDTYIQWGRMNCTNQRAKLIYTGFVGGSSYDVGGAPNKLCVPLQPQWGIYDSRPNNNAYIGGTVFHMHDVNIKNTLFDYKYTHYVIQCAVCHVTKVTSTIMIPGRKACFGDWKIEYTGYLMAGFPTHKAASEYICVDGNPDHLKKAPSWSKKSILYSVTSLCNGATPCPPYINGREMTCVVCSK